MKVLVISTSFRVNSFSQRLAKSFADGAKGAGHEVTFVSLKGLEIKHCTGCCRCQGEGMCIMRDDSQEIVWEMRNSDVVVWATPIYYYSMSGQMKTLIDRANSLYVSEHRIKDVYLLCTCADEDPSAIEGTLKGVEGWTRCLPGTRIAGTLCACGLPNNADLESTDYMTQAFEMGRKV